MKAWITFLQTQGAHIESDSATSFEESPDDYQTLINEILLCPLTHYGVISLSGPDTDKLLQGQLTCDINQLTVEQPLAAALCTVKGRIISLCHLIRQTDQSVLLITHKDLVETTLQTLNKYAVFFKTTLVDESNKFCVLGMTGSTAKSGQSVAGKDTAITATFGADQILIICPTANAQALWRELAETATPVGLDLWQLLCIRNGLANIEPATSDEFIPQMLNLQHTGAINFRKGCYTGQEIIARMQYLGKLKRRMYRLIAQTTVTPPPGTAISLTDKPQKIGHIILSTQVDQNTAEMLAVLSAEAAESSTLAWDNNPHPIEILSLPYDDKFITKSAQ